MTTRLRNQGSRKAQVQANTTKESLSEMASRIQRSALLRDVCSSFKLADQTKREIFQKKVDKEVRDSLVDRV